MAFFDKKDTQEIICSCKNTKYIHFTMKQLSWLLSLFIFFIFLVFVFGYFKGKGAAARELTEEIRKEFFADNVYASVFSLSHDSDISSPTEKISAEEKQKSEESADEQPSSGVLIQQQEQEKEEKKEYCAKLISFRLKPSAQSFVSRVNSLGISVHIKDRVTTSGGKQALWYQVITEWYKDYDELCAQVDKIKASLTLHDVRIVSRSA